ncbi:MAG: 50S ribosomal protein L18 [Candidatus Aenigmatarchaeota archaeon]
MRRKRRYLMPHRRKREGKTDYRLRLRLLKSRKPRFVVRKSNNNIICQLIKYEPNGDKVITSAEARELKKLGWPFHTGSLPSAYLTGLLCAERAKKHKVKEAVLDAGPYVITKGNCIFSALKGAIATGLKIPHSEEVLPSDERISGLHIVAYAEKLQKENVAQFKRQFSAYIKQKIDIKEMPKIFEEVKNKIIEGKGEIKKSTMEK